MRNTIGDHDIDAAGRQQGSIVAGDELQKSTDSVEKVAPLPGLRQNRFIGRRGITSMMGQLASGQERL
ncbi:MAG TPA: hypothetical protein VJ047_05960, partial [Pseudomonas sp.]|nr:hypothetical protein [Pseudomonas sp.]